MSHYFYIHFRTDGGLWFRIFGYGLNIKPASSPMLFSEREGFTKWYRIGNWKILPLRPIRF